MAFCQQPVRILSLDTSEFEAHCTLCKKTLNLSTLGVKALVSHTKSGKHQLASKSLQRSLTITHFCTPLSPVPSPSSSSSARPELGAASAISQSSNIQTIFISTPMLKVEVLWILNTVALATDLEGKNWLF